MVDLAEIQAAYYMVAATGVLVAAVFYVLNLRISQRNQELSLKTQELALKAQQQNLETRQAQLFMQIFILNCSQETADNWYKIYSADITDVQTFLRKTGTLGDLADFDHELAEAWAYVLTHYDGMGLLAQKGLIDVELLTELFPQEVIKMWEKLKPVTLELRKKYPYVSDHFEYLYNKMIEKNK
jgi:hypothetical protein